MNSKVAIPVSSMLIGPDASLLNTGRSRQDTLATLRMGNLRAQLLDYADALNSMRERMLATAAKNVDTIVPAYTNGVQAMPISYAHYQLAYAASFDRDAQRIRELYKRLNRSAMGTAVLANSSWPLNRRRMAELLGFDGIIENGMDASQVSPSDISLGDRHRHVDGHPRGRNARRHSYPISSDPPVAALGRRLDVLQHCNAAKAQSGDHHARPVSRLRIVVLHPTRHDGH